MKKQERSVVIEMAATMLKAGIDYALEHQAELMASFDKMNGKKKKSTPRRKTRAKVIEVTGATA
ncbi:MAG: hypothetical protein U9N73_06365 [Candidatus Auribacterota bacterium]|nr:hypothetical protein [Candidatus Auribacterota bacterium]